MADSKFHINFMGKRKLAAVLSVVLIVLSISSLATQGLSFGLDFTGGTLIEVGYPQPVDLNQVREQLDGAGFKKAVVQNFGSDRDVLIRMPQGVLEQMTARLAEENKTLSELVVGTLDANGSEGVELRRSEYVGAQVGEELREQGGLGMLMALGIMMLYVAFRFQIKFSLGAVVALGHDVLIVLGMFSLLGWDFDLTVLAALLAVIGYSLNDTIVVSDRIRENFRKVRKTEPVDIINLSLNQTLSRTIVTSLTTLLVLLALGIFGGELIRFFSMALIAGVVIGTYSSVYVVPNVLLATNISQEDLLIPQKEGAELDDMP